MSDDRSPIGALTGALALIVMGASPVAAQDWTEVGDAPEVVTADAQQVAGVGPLLTITGSTNTAVDDFVDSYVIDINDAASFYATTSSVFDPAASAVWDTRLFLFDADGTPMLANDDAPGVPGAASYLSGPDLFPGVVDPTAQPLQPGVHVLVITGWINDPEDAEDVDLFALSSDADGLLGPDPLAEAFDHWENDHALTMSGSYVIALQGARFIEDPDTCLGDVNLDGVVDVQDLVEVILAWDQPGGPADVTDDGIVDVQDLVTVILQWGPC